METRLEVINLLSSWIRAARANGNYDGTTFRQPIALLLTEWIVSERSVVANEEQHPCPDADVSDERIESGGLRASKLQIIRERIENEFWYGEDRVSGLRKLREELEEL